VVGGVRGGGGGGGGGGDKGGPSGMEKPKLPSKTCKNFLGEPAQKNQPSASHRQDKLPSRSEKEHKS